MNKNLLQLAKQLAGIWNVLGLNQRIMVVLTAVGVLGGLLSLAFWSSREDYRLLYGRLDDAEAAKVVSALNDAKVPHRIGANGNSIYVPGDQVHAMRMQLAARGIPKSDGIGFEIFDKPNFGISDFVQRANYVRAVQGELARTIGQLDEIEAARVMIVMPENRLLIDQKKHPTASVFVRTRGSAQLPATAVNSIRFLVANSVEGLQPNRVTVVDNRGHVLSEDTEPDSAAGLSSTQLTARRNLEQYLARKAEDMLEAVLGPGQAVVRVAAELNFDTLTRTEEKFDPEGQVPRMATINDENNDSTTATGSGGVPGVVTNTGGETNATPTHASPVTNSKLKKKTSTTEYEINKTVSNLVQGAGSIKRLSAAVFVAARMDGAGAERKSVPRSTEDLDKLRRIVQSALGIQTGADAMRSDEIVLEELPFNDGLGTETVQQLERDERREYWWEMGRSLLYPILGLGVLLVFWRTLKRTPVETIPIGIPLGQMSGHGNGRSNGNGNGHGNRMNEWMHPTEPGVVTVEVLNQLIKENPGNMSQAIRAWLTRAKPK